MRLFSALLLALAVAGLTRADGPPDEFVAITAAQAVENADGSYTVQVVAYGWGLNQQGVEYEGVVNCDAVGGAAPVDSTQPLSTSWKFPFPYNGTVEWMAFEQTYPAGSGAAQRIKANNRVEVQPHLVSIDRINKVYRPTVSGEVYWGPIAKAGGGE